MWMTLLFSLTSISHSMKKSQTLLTFGLFLTTIMPVMLAAETIPLSNIWDEFNPADLLRHLKNGFESFTNRLCAI